MLVEVRNCSRLLLSPLVEDSQRMNSAEEIAMNTAIENTRSDIIAADNIVQKSKAVFKRCGGGYIIMWLN